MGSSKLRHRVTFQKPPVDANGDPAVNANGFPVDDSYTDYVTVWAQVVGGTSTRVLGKEYVGADAIQSQNELMVTFRFRKDITADMRMIYKGLPYEIQLVTDKDGMQVWTDLLVKGWQNGGV